jgi:hypothetical protein
MWEDSSFRKPHFLSVQESVILIRGLITGYVILCGAGRHWRESSVNIPTCQLVQGSEGLSRDLIQLQKDDRGTKELSRSVLNIYILAIDSILPGMGTLSGEALLQFTRWFTLYLTLFMESRDVILTS